MDRKKEHRIIVINNNSVFRYLTTYISVDVNLMSLIIEGDVLNIINEWRLTSEALDLYVKMTLLV